ncbi:hypothetical protein CGCTS75_v001272 [Colletotrichum tropicale]|nr:hypothetical protein CGCTS75_v001272 [Colletotrichum tropicale]
MATRTLLATVQAIARLQPRVLSRTTLSLVRFTALPPARLPSSI